MSTTDIASTPLASSTVAFIGAGQMAGAIIEGLVASGVPATQLLAADLDTQRLQWLKENVGVGIAADNRAAVKAADVVMLAVKPQVLPRVLPDIAEAVGQDTLVISIAAGVTIDALEDALVPGARVIRTMPNTPALVRAGATALATGTHATDHDLACAETIFASVGITVRVGEHLINAVTGLSGSGPAYVFMMLEALADGGVKMGLPRAIALKLAGQTLQGAAQLYNVSGKHPGELKDQVTSPGGTTIAAVHVLEQNGLRAALMDAVEAAAERANALGGR